MKQTVTKQAKYSEWAVVLIGVMIFLALLMVCLPHFWMGLYNFPSGDDYDFAIATHNAVQNGGLWEALKCILWDNPADWRIKWESRWTISMLIGANPAIWGIGWYKLCIFISLFVTIFAQIWLLVRLFGQSKREKRLAAIIAGLTLIMEILYVPYPTDVFYWWTGIASYTLTFDLALCVFGGIWTAAKQPLKEKKSRGIFRIIALMAAAFLLGGTNYSVSILCVTALLLFGIGRGIYDIRTLQDKKMACRNGLQTTSLFVSLLLGLLLVFTSPSLQLQLNSRYGGAVENSLPVALLTAIKEALGLLISFFGVKNVIFLLLLLPLAYTLTKKKTFRFSYPILVTLALIMLLASEVSVNLYVDGTLGGAYTQDIWFFSCYLVVVIDWIYWIGWINHRERAGAGINAFQERFLLVKSQWGLFLWVSVWGMLLLGWMGVTELHTLTSYQAYNYVNNGYSQQYAQQWQERIEILENPDILEVEFDPIQVYGGYVQMYDLFPKDDPAHWINLSLAGYYGKNYVELIEP